MSTTMDAAPKQQTILRANPMLSAKVQWQEFAMDEGTATYGGIMAKTGIFMGMTLVGYALFYLLNQLIFSRMTPLAVGPTGAGITAAQLIMIPILFVAAIVLPIIATKKPKLMPAFGSIYSVIQGYFIANTVYSYANFQGMDTAIEALALWAIVITVFIVMLMAFLYKKGYVHAGKRYKTVMKVAFPTMIVFTIIGIILRFIPFTAAIMAQLTEQFSGLWIAFSVIGIIIASLFLISDFDMIQQTVEGKAPKMYEWKAAFGLAVTVVWIYIKVLQLLVRVLGKRK